MRCAFGSVLCTARKLTIFPGRGWSYSGAVEQIVQELGTDENRKSMRKKLQISYLAEQIKDKGEKLELHISTGKRSVFVEDE